MISVRTNPDGVTGEILINGVVAFNFNAAGTLTVPTKLIAGGFATPRMQVLTPLPTTTGVAVDASAIPSWVTRITGLYNSISTTGSNGITVQLGVGSPETANYLGSYSYLPNAAGIQGAVLSSSFVVMVNNAAASLLHGGFTLEKVSGNTWAFRSMASLSGAAVTHICAGTKTLAGALDMIRLSTVGATDTFDNGSFGLIYEGLTP